jgi:hypothetical protein
MSMNRKLQVATKPFSKNPAKESELPGDMSAKYGSKIVVMSAEGERVRRGAATRNTQRDAKLEEAGAEGSATCEAQRTLR